MGFEKVGNIYALLLFSKSFGISTITTSSHCNIDISLAQFQYSVPGIAAPIILNRNVFFLLTVCDHWKVASSCVKIQAHNFLIFFCW